MKKLFKILFAPILWIFHACSPLGNPVDIEKSNNHYYNSSKSQIRYSPMGNWFELGNTEMKADVESFEVLSRFISKDKGKIFFEAYPVDSDLIDFSTFNVKNQDFMTNIGLDKDHVYSFDKKYENSSYRINTHIVEGADPKTYTRTSWDWANDGKYHFYKDQQIMADYDSFEILNDYFIKDKEYTFARKSKKFELIGADAATLKILDESSHAIDHKMVYWLPFFTKNAPDVIPIPYTNEAEVQFLNRYFLRVSGTIFYDGVARTDIDSESFEVIDHSYAKDAVHVYYKDKIVANADPATFKKMEGSYVFKDKNATYVAGKQEVSKSDNPQ